MTLAVEDAPDRSIRNRSALIQSDHGSCFFCLRTFPSAEVIAWTDQGETALCPNCHIDAVLPGEIDRDTLVSINEYCFCRVARF